MRFSIVVVVWVLDDDVMYSSKPNICKHAVPDPLRDPLNRFDRYDQQVWASTQVNSIFPVCVE